MNKDFLNSFVNWIIKNNSKLQEFFDETFNIYDVAAQIYNGDLGYTALYLGTNKYGNPDTDWQAVWATEDFAFVFLWYNEQYNNGNINPSIIDSELEDYQNYENREKILKVTVSKWKQLVLKIDSFIKANYPKQYKKSFIYKYLYKDCQLFADGHYDEDFEDDDDY